MRWLKRLLCRLFSHDFEWEMHGLIDRPDALVCRRCGHREEDGMEYCHQMINRE